MAVPKEVLRQFVEILDSSNPARVLTMFTPDAWVEVTGSSAISGWRRAADLNLQPNKPVFKAIPKGIRMEIVTMIEERDRAYCECIGRSMTADGRRYNSYFLFWVRVQNGKIRQLKTFMDTQRFYEIFKDDPQIVAVQRPAWGVGPWASGGPPENEKTEVLPLRTYGTGMAKYDYALDGSDPAAVPKTLVRLFVETLDGPAPPTYRSNVFAKDCWVLVGGVSSAAGWSLAGGRSPKTPITPMYTPTLPNGISIKVMNVIGEGDEAVCEARGKAVVAATGVVYDNHYTFWLKARGQQAQYFKEFSDTHLYDVSFEQSSMFTLPKWAGIGPIGMGGCPAPRPSIRTILNGSATGGL